MCIFCKIANGEIPSYKIYEDDNFLAFLDISQATIGHTLVIPKKHYENIFELPEDIDIFKVVVKVANALNESLNIDGLNIVNNNKEAAGQTVNHYHIHLIPRYKDDDFKIVFSSNNLDKNDFISLQQKITDNIK